MEKAKQDSQVNVVMQEALPRWRTVKDLAKDYNCTDTTIWNMVRDGRLPKPTRFSSQMLRWHIDDLEEHDAKLRECGGVEK